MKTKLSFSRYLLKLNFLFVVFLLSCAGPKGEEFIGTWHSNHHYGGTMQIRRSGNNFAVVGGRYEGMYILSETGNLIQEGHGIFSFSYEKVTDRVVLSWNGLKYFDRVGTND